MKRTSTLRRTKAMRRTPMRRGARKSKYARRERDWNFMGWVKTLPCAVLAFPPDLARVTPCSRGEVEADHMGARGIGQKADDRTCAPLCTNHHRERTDHYGCFKNLDQAGMRMWRALVLHDVATKWVTRSKAA